MCTSAPPACAELICRALTSLYSWLHILIFTPRTHTVILLLNQYRQCKCCAPAPALKTYFSPQSSLTCPIILLNHNFHFLFEMQWLCETKKQTQTQINQRQIKSCFFAVCTKTQGRRSKCPAESTLLDNVQAFVRSVAALKAH